MRRVVLAAVVLALAAAGCGGVESEPNLALAAERTEAAGSGRFEVRGVLTGSGESVSVECTGAASYESKRVHVRCKYDGRGVLEAIAIGRDTYLRDDAFLGFGGGNGKWIKESMDPDDEDALASLSPQKLLRMMREATSETERIGEESVRGEATVRYRLTVDCGAADLECKGSTPVDVWIADDGIVRRIAVDDDSGEWTFEFFDFGAEVAIERPPASQVVEEAGLGSSGVTVQPSGPCTPDRARPISDDAARNTLRRHGFSIEADTCGVLTNSSGGNGQDVLTREGIVFCFVERTPPDGAPSTVVRRGADGADAELVLQNLRCTIFTDSPTGEEKVDRLEAAFEELQRVIQP